MLSQKLPQIIRLTTLYCMTRVVQGPQLVLEGCNHFLAKLRGVGCKLLDPEGFDDRIGNVWNHPLTKVLVDEELRNPEQGGSLEARNGMGRIPEQVLGAGANQRPPVST